jgi:hypothetical protein
MNRQFVIFRYCYYTIHDDYIYLGMYEHYPGPVALLQTLTVNLSVGFFLTENGVHVSWFRRRLHANGHYDGDSSNHRIHSMDSISLLDSFDSEFAFRLTSAWIRRSLQVFHCCFFANHPSSMRWCYICHIVSAWPFRGIPGWNKKSRSRHEQSMEGSLIGLLWGMCTDRIHTRITS